MFRTLFPSTALSGASTILPAGGEKTIESLPASQSMVAFAAGGKDVHDMNYYLKCCVGGILSCGLTHTFVVPLDIVKCRMQVNPAEYKGLVQGLGRLGQEGASAYAIGWLPTLIGYSAQGRCKFGFYEYFKDLYAELAGAETAHEYRTLLYLSASASAEVIADAALCPMESVKVRMQTSPPEAKFPLQLGAAVNRIMSQEGVYGFYKGLGPLWGRQVPYTMVKFAAFERTVEAFYKHVFTAGKENYSKPTQLSITFASGYIAGVFCAVVSHPADTIVSKLNQSKDASIGKIIAEMGIVNLATKGLPTRILMVGTLTGLQWWIYDTFKAAVGLQTSGGAAPKK